MKKLLLLAVVFATACHSETPPPISKAKPKVPPPSKATVEAGGAKLEIAGPFAHENMAVYFIRSDQRDERDFITLDEGLKNGWVKVTEKSEVNELQIENTSEKALFLQEGDRVQGGKQDRIVATSFVVPGQSGVQPLPAFCIEHGRWQAHQPDAAGGTALAGAIFEGTENHALATKEIREAAKMKGDQSEVWKRVAEQKQDACGKLGAPNTNSSFNETLDSPKIKKISDDGAAALGKLIDEHSDAVGVAFCVNGKIEEINIYPGHALLKKIYPRLVQSYAVEAALGRDAKKSPPVAAAEIARFMKEGKEKGNKTENINTMNCARIYDYVNKLECTTSYDGKPVHRQWMSKSPEAPRPKIDESQEQINPPVQRQNP